jgi:hypothetical protein
VLFDYQKAVRMFAIGVFVTVVMTPVVHAEDDDDEHIATVSNAKWLAECGSCHVAYPPRLLPAESWRALMAGLDKHFGSDASLDAPAAREIGAFLDKHAGGRRHDASGHLRITETRWFKHEHDEVSARVWKSAKVKSPANCAACHPQAERGSFNEHEIRIPR